MHLIYNYLVYSPTSKCLHYLVFYVKKIIFLISDFKEQCRSSADISYQRDGNRLQSSSSEFSLTVQLSRVFSRNKLLLTDQEHKLVRKAADSNIKKVCGGLGEQLIF